MKLLKQMRKLLFTLSLLFFLIPCNSQQLYDSRKHEVGELIQKYMSISADPYRGLDSAEWNKRVQLLMEKVNQSKNEKEFYFALRYFAPLINDGHFIFPDYGSYNRNGIFNKKDTLFPYWVKCTLDDRVFVVADYSGVIPTYSELIEINGIRVSDLSSQQHYLNPCETVYAYDNMNKLNEERFKRWSTFSNYLFCENIHSPFSVKYNFNGRIDSVLIEGKTRNELHKLYKKKRKSIKTEKPYKSGISYTKKNDRVGVLDINLFWGGGLISAIVNPSKDKKFEKTLQSAMLKINDDNLEYLVIDLRDNVGGYLKNVYLTLSYFIDTTFYDETIYKVSKESKTNSALDLISNDIKMFYGKEKEEDRKKTISIYKNMQDGDIMRIDTLIPMAYSIPKPKFFFNGKIIVLTNSSTFSASIEFCNLIKKYKRGLIAGSSPGGYTRITGGPTTPVNTRITKIFPMRVPYTIISSSDSYDYLLPDIIIEQDLNVWLENKDDTLDQLIKRIID